MAGQMDMVLPIAALFQSFKNKKKTNPSEWMVFFDFHKAQTGFMFVSCVVYLTRKSKLTSVFSIIFFLPQVDRTLEKNENFSNEIASKRLNQRKNQN